MRMYNPGDLHHIEMLADEGWGELDEYYPETARGELEPSDPYYGRNVIWDAEDGRSIRVDPNYLTSIAGNIFYPDKLAAIVSGIEQAEDRLVFTAPYGTVNVVEPIDVKESIEAAEHGDEDLDRPLTTGDEDLDKWLVDPEQFLEDEVGYEDHYDDPAEFAEEHARVTMEMEEALAVAIANNEGDLGALTFTIRDGNHRAFGALLAGEPYVYMIVAKSQMQDLLSEPDHPRNRPILEALE